MKDPYSVLNVSPNASDEEIKKAYRELARKYHPDNYIDNPLADLASEKMKEINEAYDTITKQRANGGDSYGGGKTRNSYNYSGSSEFAQVRAAINANNIALAERLLAESSNHNAEWNFLMGSVAYRKGWLDQARRYYQTACSMDPGNMEYRQALNYMQNAGAGPYRTNNYNSGMDTCDCCSTLICADCCCECMGGDLIRCC